MQSSPTPPDSNGAAQTSFKAAAVEPLAQPEAKPPVVKPVEEPISIADKLLAELLPEDAVRTSDVVV